MASVYELVLKEFDDAVNPMVEGRKNAVRESIEEIRRYVGEFINETVRPALQTILADIESSDPDFESVTYFVSSVLGQLGGYSQALSFVDVKDGVTLEIDEEFSDLFNHLEYGTKFTPTFPHLGEIDSLIAKAAESSVVKETGVSFSVRLT